MAKDAELDRLKAAHDAAFQRKQEAFQAQQDAWRRRSAARDEMNRAFECKRQVEEVLNRTWEHYQSVCNANGSRIDLINSDQERAYYNMKSSFENASSAYDRGDGASASSYAQEGHYYKEQAQSLVAERRRLVAEIQSAREAHEAIKPEFQRLKENFNFARRCFNSAKAEHERAREAFKRAKEDFDSCAKAFKTRLEKVKSENQKRRQDRESILDKAGIPHQYRDNVYISKGSGGDTNIYFGGIGKPDGDGHGHYVLNKSGKVTYRRDPYREHGSHNFTDNGKGGTLYDRSARPGFVPNRVVSRDNETKARDGVFYDRNRPIDIHVTQVYEDNVRLSWDTDGVEDRAHHMTDQNIRKGRSKRHIPPNK